MILELDVIKVLRDLRKINKDCGVALVSVDNHVEFVIRLGDKGTKTCITHTELQAAKCDLLNLAYQRMVAELTQ